MTIPEIRFTAMLVEANHLDIDDFKCWAFCPGMRFGSTDKWWGDFGPRDFPHEGVDFCLYEDSAGRLCQLGASARIPVMDDGIVRAVFKDYLGRAIIVAHEKPETQAGNYLSVYAHTRPGKAARPGRVVRAGEVIATIADTRHSKAGIMPHLHLSLGRPAPDLVYENFVWNIMRNPARVTLKDPMDRIDGPWRELASAHCRQSGTWAGGES